MPSLNVSTSVNAAPNMSSVGSTELPRSAGGGYVLFVWSTTGLEVEQRDGDVPSVGDRIDGDGLPLVVTKVGASPLPGDDRRCAYTSAA